MTEETPGRGKSGRFERTIETAERDAEAARLKSRCLGYREIAEQLGFANEGSAYKAVQRALKAIVQEPAEEVKQLELERLDRMYHEVLAVLERQHVTVSNGRVVTRQAGYEVDADGEPLRDGDDKLVPKYEEVLDDGPVLQAVDRLLRIQERRARYLGLDVATRVSVDAENLGREIGELLAGLGDDGRAESR
jgi:hypothetical protein